LVFRGGVGNLSCRLSNELAMSPTFDRAHHSIDVFMQQAVESQGDWCADFISI
jgi:hypothetical protein